MKITTVRYERLFSLANYNNEKIAFEAIVQEEKENPDVVIGQLFLKVLAIEDTLAKYRALLQEADYADQAIRDQERHIANIIAEIPRLESEIEKIKASPDGYADCSYQLGQLKRLKSELPRCQEDLKKLHDKNKQINEKLESMRQAIKDGKFGGD